MEEVMTLFSKGVMFLYPALGYAYGCNPGWSRGGKFVHMYMVVRNSMLTLTCVVRHIQLLEEGKVVSAYMTVCT